MRSKPGKRYLPEGGFFAFFIVSLLVALSGFPDTVLSAGTHLELIGSAIPRRLPVGSHYIFHESDTLYLNGRHLKREIDYTFDKVIGAFDLSRLTILDTDTLSIAYQKLPDWLLVDYGRTIPEATSTDLQNLESSHFDSNRALVKPSGVNFSGAKSFRFTARSSGASNFSQTLDLTVSGPLSPGLEISGAISDRGYDPSYGTANSRLNELDKINLKLTSRKLDASIGDINIINPLATGSEPGKQVFGASVVIHDPNWQVNALAARPKGRFATVRFYGQDGRQGPYQIGEGAGIAPIVPGSEIVWLDGRKLERGANKDYLIDYPVGRITFNVNHPLDSRNRIEIDFEPQATDYKGELFAGGGGVSIGDSGLFIAVQWLREGDDQNQPLMTDLSDADKLLLSGVGDNVTAAVRSGVQEDSTGAYNLISDSLPDTVFSFVGAGNGDYSITFSYIGNQKGDYRFLGSGNYEYVGAGDGDYLPQVAVPAPERTEYACVRAGLQNKILGNLVAEFRQTRFDRNLLSDLDDGDNDGKYYSFESKRNWRWKERENRVAFRTYRIDTEYRERTRLHSPDFSRNYLIPEDFVASTDESFIEAKTLLSPLHFLSVQSDLSRLVYHNRFRSITGDLGAILSPAEWLDILLTWKTTKSHLDTTTTGADGKSDNYIAQLHYKLSNHYSIASMYEHDIRRNDYRIVSSGTQYNRFQMGLEGQSERLQFSNYTEDTLVGDWKNDLRRNRLSLASDRTLGLFSYNLNLTHQWLERPQINDKSFLGRFGYQYRNTHRRLTIGGAYMVSTETRNERGLSYIEVEPGQGDYILDNGQYVPDPDGDYLQVEEVLSDRSRVRRGEKSFHFSKDWRTVLVRFNSHIEEELLDGGERSFLWIIPFVSDKNQPYLFYVRRYDADLRFFPMRGFHVVNIALSDNIRSRDVAGVTRRDLHRTETISLKQAVGDLFLKETLELLKVERDQYYSGAGNVNGFKLGLELKQQFSSGEVSAGGSYRQAKSSTGDRSDLYALVIGSRYQVIRKGEVRSSVELYHQTLSSYETQPSYILTENKPGEQGIIWSVDFKYGVKEDLRINFSLSGRHADNRTARITGRGEVVAGF